MVPLELTIQRALERIRRGGNEVREQKIRDRYERLWDYIHQAIGIADAVEVLDNGSARVPFRLCASFEHGESIGAPSWPKWAPEALRSENN